MTAEQTNRADVVKQGDREIRVERIFDAPREKVFALMTDPELIPQWWGPRSMQTRVDYMEPVTGGRYRFVHNDPEGNEYGFLGAYREVTAPERIVQTFEWEGMAGHVSVETATFEDLGDGRTRFVSTSIFHTSDERDGMYASGMEGGLQETYEQLDEVLAAQS